jgi:hypothetical protein
MNVKRVIAVTASAGLIVASTLGVGAGVANAGSHLPAPNAAHSVDWHGRGHWHDGGGDGHGWRDAPWWLHRWGWGWHW